MRNSNSTISKGIDWSLVWIYLALVFIGLSAIFAATYTEGDPFLQSFIAFKTDYSKQFYFLGIAVIVGFFILLTDSKFFPATANIWYVIGIILLFVVACLIVIGCCWAFLRVLSCEQGRFCHV